MNEHKHSPEELQAMYDDMRRVFANSLAEIRKHFPEDEESVKKDIQDILDDFRQQYPSVT